MKKREFKKRGLGLLVIGVCLLMPGLQESYALQKPEELQVVNENARKQQLIDLSAQKWQWMSQRNVDSLGALFHEEAVFVHMGGTMNKEQELNTIRTGGIHYKHAEIQETSVRFAGQTAVILDKIRLTAVVGDKEVVNPFVVTEVYVRMDGRWSLVSLSFTRLLNG